MSKYFLKENLYQLEFNNETKALSHIKLIIVMENG